jgi:hypothetical protein
MYNSARDRMSVPLVDAKEDLEKGIPLSTLRIENTTPSSTASLDAMEMIVSLNKVIHLAGMFATLDGFQDVFAWLKKEKIHILDFPFAQGYTQRVMHEALV